MKISWIKIYGERNTGTNYLRELIARNLEVNLKRGVEPWLLMKIQAIFPPLDWVRDWYFKVTETRNLGWKHTLVKEPEWFIERGLGNDHLFFVSITKNPYSWLLSLYRRPHSRQWKEKPSFEAFLERPWLTVGREDAPDQYENPVRLWNEKNARYLRLGGTLPTLNLKYEDILADPKSTVDEIADAFSLQFKQPSFSNYVQSTKDEEKDYDYYRHYYLDEMWREQMSAGSIQTINQSLDMAVVEHFGYSVLS